MTTVRGDAGTIRAGVGDEEGSGTVHARGGDISSGFGATPSGTVHVSGPDIISGHDPSPISAGLVLNVGDSVILNKVDYRYQGVISKSSGEAEIFLISNNGNKCVFKLYYPNFKPKEDILKQLKQLKHEDIINVIDYGYHHDRFFEIMDYAEGGTIDKYLPIKDTVRIKQIIAEVINAYKYCHGHGVIHKDIKPQNFYFKNSDGTDLLIGDFGISTLLETGMSRHLTSQSLTVGYAAPEMYGIGGKVYIGKEVDYYALGITLIHIWGGKSPFDGLGMHAISNLTTSDKVHIPEDMPREMQKMVKGLITVDYTKRWGYEEIQRWLKGEDVPVHFQTKEISYPPYKFGPKKIATTAEELADILKKNTDKAKKHLYSGKLSAWVNLFNQGLAVELDRIIEDDYPKDQDAGIQKAIYILNPDEPYEQDGKEYRTTEELGDALEDRLPQYINDLSKFQFNHPFYLYLEAHDAKKEADTFRSYFKTFSTKKALNTMILELRGRDKIKIDGVLFFTPEELIKYKDQPYLLNELKDTESALSLWIEGSQSQDIRTQVARWRMLDHNWQDISTFQFALVKDGPFSDVKSEEKDIKYKIACYLVSKAPDKAVKALGMWLESDEDFYRIALSQDFTPIKSEVYSLLRNYMNKYLSRRKRLITKLRGKSPESYLITRYDKETDLSERRMKKVKQVLKDQGNKQRKIAEIDIQVKKLSAIEFKSKKYRFGRVCGILLIIAAVALRVLSVVYKYELSYVLLFLTNALMMHLSLLLLHWRKWSPETKASVARILPQLHRDSLPQLILLCDLLCGGIFCGITWIMTKIISLKTIMIIYNICFCLFGILFLCAGEMLRTLDIREELSASNYGEQLRKKLRQIDDDIKAKEAKLPVDTLKDIYELSDDSLEQSLATEK